MALEDKKIKGFTATEIIEQMMNVCKWLDVFNDAGEAIYGEEYDVVLALVGLSTVGLIRPLEELAKIGEEKAKVIRGKQADATLDDMLKQLNIKKESDGTVKPS